MRMCGRCGPRQGRSLSKGCGNTVTGHETSSASVGASPPLKAVAAQRIAARQDELPIGVPAKQRAESLEITSSRMGRLLDVLAAADRQLGFDEASGGDAVFEQLVTARIIEPTSKQDAARVLAEAGVRSLSNRTVKRSCPGMLGRSGGTGCRGRARPAPRSDLRPGDL